jgi:hypothetical protein
MDRSPESKAGLDSVGALEWKPPPWPEGLRKPGVYDGEPWEEYASWKAMNSTALKHLIDLSPKHARHAMTNRTDSRDRRFGRAEHALLLEGPEAFARRFLVACGCQAVLKSGARKGEPCGLTGAVYDGSAWYCGKHAPEGATEPEDYVTAEQYERMQRAIEAVYAHPAVKLIRQHGGTEVSVVWERDGLPCKARLDKLILDAKCPDTILDVKKCQAFGIARHDLEASIVRYGWDVQARFYRDGVEAVTGKRCDFIWLFVEDGPPYDVCPLRASKRWMEVGRCRLNRAWQAWKWCIQTDTWPGVAVDIQDSDPPKWLSKRYGA